MAKRRLELEDGSVGNVKMKQTEKKRWKEKENGAEVVLKKTVPKSLQKLVKDIKCGEIM